ncbi:MAG: type II and III secretion system protein family protein [Paludibacterium sp.]|uniref:type II and III secretion system protein family protein n=1 Tax=Paludibacterium sp. TaxID=1917523 RepID=UPI0025EABFA1|nr:type II and III secretion system protein family protein [Paludibacterium sp.]MBV8046641.1 type II and III secretion system protein family protein [Paludibacterium sp.]MBV8648638.1 type II and III secretion system protein family protein [Paludibacterium sp.]
MSWRVFNLACTAILAGCAFSVSAGAAPGLVAGASPCSALNGAPPLRVTLPLGKSTNLELREPARLRALGNPAVAQTVQMGPKSLYLLGVGLGTTNLFLRGANGRCSLVDVTVQVDIDGLRHLLAAHLPDEREIQVGAAAHLPVLSGTVSDGVAAEQALTLARQFIASARSISRDDKGMGGLQGEVINLLRVAAPQQVMLEVKIAEVSKNLLSQLGISGSLSGGIGNIGLGLTSSLLNTAKASSLLALVGARGQLGVTAEKSDGLVKVLAEPNLVAVSGQPAHFLAGGKIFLPVPQDRDKVVLQQEPFGVGLTFTPTVLRQGLIHLQVAPEVSELSESGASIKRHKDEAWTLPVITTRRAQTSVQVYDGQSFAIGGLLKNNVTGTVKGLPGLMDLPILGALFRSTDYRNERTELVFIVTPRLVRGMPAPPALPTDTFGQVDGNKVLLDGRFEGAQPAGKAAAPAPADKEISP